MELTELSLAPAKFSPLVEKSTTCSSSESENNPSRKRKFLSADHLLKKGPQTSVDLHARDPLPIDWEQCLDLESGKMYYLNRKTLRKSWNWPKDQKLDLDLELNMSPTIHVSKDSTDQCSSSNSLDQDYSTSHDKKSSSDHESSSSNNMVALACLNCHLLVILSKSSPSCPNCKYVHSLPAAPQTPHYSKVSPAKSFNTLSLLN
ncbi:hypothetical protein Tsubulata_010147 [Turnera subulata]|uniref:WW domain-containing protein n=1 Tax=Turnera subulata TaxID=218843 RepID=A0A9Q0G879_9ROSI|nr:hypothetical protein Tsubulata_010147 [Turnera subulata]